MFLLSHFARGGGAAPVRLFAKEQTAVLANSLPSAQTRYSGGPHARHF